VTSHGRARFAFGLLAARDIKCMVDAIESAVATPKYKVVKADAPSGEEIDAMTKHIELKRFNR
jgi:hypothetical protein